MAIKYDKLFKLMKERGMKPHALRRDKIVGCAALEKLKGRPVNLKGKSYQGYVDTRVINNICEYLKCQPGEIMEWIPDEPGEAESTEERSEAESPEAGNNEGRE